MPGVVRPFSFANFLSVLLPLLGLLGCSASQPPARPVAAAVASPPPIFTPPAGVLPQAAPPAPVHPVMLGIDVLEADNFAAVRGKRIGLLTHPAGVNRRGISTIEILRRAPGVQLVALYAVEHGLYNEHAAGKPFPDGFDAKTGLPVFSLYNPKTKFFRPTPAQLKPIDALVIDLQDIGTRSYTFSGAMKSAMESCFENGKEVIVLDRPNPLGGLKVSGPPIDPQHMSDVGRFSVPYVHGLTIGELAVLAKATPAPGGLAVSDAQRAAGRLTVIPMRGWSRRMRWTETGLPFIPTSPRIRDFPSVQGYPMTGLGTMSELRGFSHGVGNQHEFRGVAHPRIRHEDLEKELNALNLPGIRFRRVSVPNAKSGKPAIGTYVEIIDYERWDPCALNFHLLRIAARAAPRNPYGALTAAERRTVLVHLGSQAFFNDFAAKGARTDIEAWLAQWRDQARAYQEQSRKFWLYPY